MAAAGVGKRASIVLYSKALDVNSHQVRFVLAEKGVPVELVDITPDTSMASFAVINPYGTLPTLVDRDLVLHETNIIMEYLDERFPHPPLLPVYPVAKAKSRLRIYSINHDWYPLLHQIEQSNADQSTLAKQQLLSSLQSMGKLFSQHAFFMSDEFSLVDCCLAPLLWRLTMMGIDLEKQSKAVHNYAERVFKRASFKASLSDVERELQQTAVLA